jgi:hypothetical protein
MHVVRSRGEVVMMSRVTNTSGAVSASNTSDATVPTAVGFHMELESVEDFSDLYQCGLGQEQLDGRMQPFADHFDIDACCDECEKQIINLVRRHLHEYQKALGADDSNDSGNSGNSDNPYDSVAQSQANVNTSKTSVKSTVSAQSANSTQSVDAMKSAAFVQPADLTPSNDSPKQADSAESTDSTESNQCPRELEMKCLRALAVLASEDPSDSADFTDTSDSVDSQ